ncbi:hypothetical protein SLEP1_g25471 [Rubroshorea leprosula]|uniref:Uncharacterized protein n=1 Tax=Rubroshorea leprosula TaxID=152421 RepID=A0AAV5JTJ6_9ROSI|nr:hypothetical protein SLEP1_g25471 [Rubroshorea leprosula]
MSLKGTMSVVGSEVMPLDYGNMDSESSPSPSSSERTVEEKGNRRVVEEEEDEIPSNILEAGGNVDGCYDPELDIVSEVRGYVSELGSRGGLRGLVGNCNLPHHVLIRPAGVNERACSAPQDHWMPLYVHYLIAGLRFPIPELLVGGKGEKGWYYFGPRSSSKENRSLFSFGPSSIKGWKEKFFFVDDTEWSRGDVEVEQLSAWKAKKTKQNNYKLNEDEMEEVEKLVREEGDVMDIMYLTSPKVRFSFVYFDIYVCFEIEMDSFFDAAGGLRIPKKPRKKSKTSTVVEKRVAKTEQLSSTSARAVEMQPRPKPVMGGSEEASEEVALLHRKKRKVAELEEAVVRGPSKGKELIPPHSYQKSLFEATNTTGAKRFLNATLLESASWVNALVQEYAESKEKEELQKRNNDMQRRLDEVLPSVTELQNDNDTLSTRLIFEERKRKICEDKLEAQDKYIENMKKGVAELKKNVNLLVHNGMEEHIGNFLNSSTFENIINLYRLPTAIVAFIDCRKKVKAQYPEVDVTTVTFGEQEEGVEEDGESLVADFQPLIKLRWERDAEGRTIFPSTFDAELVAVEEEEEEEEEARGAGVKNQADLAEVQPPVVHPVSFDEV